MTVRFMLKSAGVLLACGRLPRSAGPTEAVSPAGGDDARNVRILDAAAGRRRSGRYPEQQRPVGCRRAFDGEDLSAWVSANGGEAAWPVHDGVFTVDKSRGDILTRQSFENFQLHLEWCVPENITGESQSRGNSGVYLQDKYEIQILDGYRNETYVNGQVGSVYKQTPPLVNAMRRPGEWNVFDIIYSAPVFKKDGTYRIPPYVTVILNGVVLQNHTAILGTTEYIGFPRVVPHGAGPLRLQAHGDPSAPISFRNIWIREL